MFLIVILFLLLSHLFCFRYYSPEYNHSGPQSFPSIETCLWIWQNIMVSKFCMCMCMYARMCVQVCGQAYGHACVCVCAWAHAHSGRIWGGHKTSCESFREQCPTRQDPKQGGDWLFQIRKLAPLPKTSLLSLKQNLPVFTCPQHLTCFTTVTCATLMLSQNLRVTQARFGQSST